MREVSKYIKIRQYWDNKEVKLEEVNFNIVKDMATAINLYDTKAIDRVILRSEFVDEL